MSHKGNRAAFSGTVFLCVCFEPYYTFPRNASNVHETLQPVPRRGERAAEYKRDEHIADVVLPAEHAQGGNQRA